MDSEGKEEEEGLALRNCFSLEVHAHLKKNWEPCPNKSREKMGQQKKSKWKKLCKVRKSTDDTHTM